MNMKEYILNCDNDGILTKQDTDYLISIGKYKFVKDEFDNEAEIQN